MTIHVMLRTIQACSAVLYYWQGISARPRLAEAIELDHFAKPVTVQALHAQAQVGSVDWIVSKLQY